MFSLVCQEVFFIFRDNWYNHFLHFCPGLKKLLPRPQPPIFLELFCVMARMFFD